MIKRLLKSKFDTENLSRLKTVTSNSQRHFNYKHKIVKKPWGYEYLMFENRHAAVWVLYLKNGHATSMHCHPNKKSSLIVLSGRIVLSSLEGWIELKKGGGAIVSEAVFHSSKAISKEGAFIMEIESPPNKKDLARLKDDYGRENLEYEGKDMVSKNVSEYEYIDFHEIRSNRRFEKTIRGCYLTLFWCVDRLKGNISDKLNKESGHLIVLLAGKLRANNGDLILDTGDVGLLKEIQNQSAEFDEHDIMYLIINHSASNLK